VREEKLKKELAVKMKEIVAEEKIKKKLIEKELD